MAGRKTGFTRTACLLICLTGCGLAVGVDQGGHAAPPSAGPGGRAASSVAPPALRVGDTIGIVAPAAPLDAQRVEQARERLHGMGFRTRIIGDVYARRGYLAGSDDARARALMAAYEDPQVRAIFCGAGGFGTTRILDQIDFDVIRRNPKVLVGYSDVTALHLAIHRETHQITFHGPNLMWGLGSPDRNLTPFSSASLWRWICDGDTLASFAAGHPTGPREQAVPGFAEADLSTWQRRRAYDLSLCEPTTPPPIVIRGGRGRGPLVGGNLSLVCALMGTRWEIETRGRLLFLEDVNEAPYRIDRFLQQLRQAGKLDGLAGVILGRWRKCTSDKPERSLSLEEVFSDHFAEAPYPVVLRFPVGHVRDNATLPVGGLAELDTASMTLRIVEPTVQETPAGTTAAVGSLTGSP